jgi:hypothetical protein
LIPENIPIYQFPEKIGMNGSATTTVGRGRPVFGKRMGREVSGRRGRGTEKMMGGIKGEDLFSIFPAS